MQFFSETDLFSRHFNQISQIVTFIEKRLES